MTRPRRNATPALLGLMAWWGNVSGVNGAVAPHLAARFAASDAEIAGAFAWIGLAAPALGHAADRLGRRRLALSLASVLPLGAAASARATSLAAFAPPAPGAADPALRLVLAFTGLAVGANAATAAFRALATEAVPTHVRGQLGGALAAASGVGWLVAMVGTAALAERLGSVGAAVSALALLVAPAAALVVLGLSERAPGSPRSRSRRKSPRSPRSRAQAGERYAKSIRATRAPRRDIRWRTIALRYCRTSRSVSAAQLEASACLRASRARSRRLPAHASSSFTARTACSSRSGS